MHIQSLLVLLLSIFASLAFGETETPGPEGRVNTVEGTLDNTPKELIDYCKTVECRKNTRFKVKLKDGSYYEYKGYIDPPAVQPNIVTIYPGEEIFIEADLDGEKLVNLKQVSESSNPNKTISIRFWQEASIRDGTEMMLKIVNPFNKSLRYEAGMMTFESSNLQYTSSCPVLPGKVSYEHWPFPLFQLAFANIRLIDTENGEVTCK